MVYKLVGLYTNEQLCFYKKNKHMQVSGPFYIEMGVDRR